MEPTRQMQRQQLALKMFTVFAAAVLLVACLSFQQVAAGGNKGNKGKGGGEEDIIMYNGNIVMRGDKQGGSIIMANQHPTSEEVEFSPQFFTGFGEMGGQYRRRR